MLGFGNSPQEALVASLLAMALVWAASIATFARESAAAREKRPGL